MEFSTSSFPGYFPIQSILYKDKDKDWRHQCVDGVINICYAYGRTRRSSSRNKKRNYNLFNNRIDKSDFDYALNPLNLSKEAMKEFNFPATIQPYDIISPYFHLLLGEEAKRIFNPIVLAINEDAISEKENIKKKRILEVLQEMLFQELQGQEKEEAQKALVDKLKKYSKYTPGMMVESAAQHFLQYFNKAEALPEKFNTCFKHALLSSEEIMSVEKVGSTVQARIVNPLEVWFQLPNNSEYLDEAEKIYERNLMTASEIIDEFYEFLTKEQIDEIEQWGQSSGTMGSMYSNDYIMNIPEVDSIYSFEDNYFNRGIPVHRVRWKSKKKMGTLHYLDENGQEQEMLVEETFKINKKDKTQYIEWFWINEYWEGVRIGQDIYLDTLIRPRRQQFRRQDNISRCKSGYFGTVYSALNSQSVSLMDRLVPWIYLYLIIWYRTELAMAKNFGKIAEIDISLIPDNYDSEKWMYYAVTMGFAFTNRYNESNKAAGAAGAVNQYSQNKIIDLEQFNYIDGHIKLLQFIEERIQMTSGITRQRLGEITSSELVGNTERAVTQSSHITEPYFAPHEYFKLRVCEAVIEVAKECLEGKSKVFQYITDEATQALFKVNGDDLQNSDFGVFVTNTTKDEQKLQMMRGLLQAAIQNEKVNLSQVVDIINSDSFADIKARLLQAEEDMQKSMQEQQEMELKFKQKVEEETNQLERDIMENDNLNKQLDRETQIEVAQLKATGSDALSTKGEDTERIREEGKAALERSKEAFKQFHESKKLELEKKKIKAEEDRTKADREHEQRQLEKDRQTKLQVERMKLQAAKAKAKASISRSAASKSKKKKK